MSMCLGWGHRVYVELSLSWMLGLEFTVSASQALCHFVANSYRKFVLPNYAFP